MNAYILNQNLELVGIVDDFQSFIWANKYNEIGDCELYLPASADNLNLLQKGYYIARLDDYMICRINRIEIDTDIEKGNYLIANGTDAKGLLDQRIIWDLSNCDGNLEDFIRAMITDAVCFPSISERQMKKSNGDQLIYLGNKANFTEMLTEQVSYQNLGTKIREYCKKYNWGYKVYLDENKLYFELYKGENKANDVIFSDKYENLASTKYVDDATKLGNVTLIGGTGDGYDRKFENYGTAESTDRFELFVDAKSISDSISYEELTEIYPTTAQGGQGYIVSHDAKHFYKMHEIDIQIVDDAQLAKLQTDYPTGTIVTIDGNDFYRIPEVEIAEVESNNPADNSKAILNDIIYSIYLLNKGAEEVAKYGEKTTFQGSIIPDITFAYKKDYNLGDVVTIQNEYGIRKSVRIVEVVEVSDENGYSVQPKFEDIEEI